MEILYEDNSICVIIKPVGFSSEYTEKGESVPSQLMSHFEKQTGSKAFVGVVHRLDTGVSGVMVYAKTKAANAFLSTLLANGGFKKEYLAVVHGKLASPADTLEDLLFKDSRKNKSFVVKRERKGVKKASLSYCEKGVAESDGEALSLLAIRLNTGRTHQIRVQFSSRKHPLIGDGKYGAADNAGEIALFCASLSFIHPETKKEMTFSAKPEMKYPWSLFYDIFYSL